MSNISEGVLIFNNWFESAKMLSGLEFKKLFIAIYEYQIHGIEPPPFSEKGEAIARNIFPFIDKRLKGALCAKLGAGALDSLTATPDPHRDPARVKSYTPHTKDKKRQDKTSISSYEDDQYWRDFFEIAIAHALKEAAPTDEPSVPDKN